MVGTGAGSFRVLGLRGCGKTGSGREASWHKRNESHGQHSRQAAVRAWRSRLHLQLRRSTHFPSRSNWWYATLSSESEAAISVRGEGALAAHQWWKYKFGGPWTAKMSGAPSLFWGPLTDFRSPSLISVTYYRKWICVRWMVMFSA